jgi:hypothetical protein
LGNLDDDDDDGDDDKEEDIGRASESIPENTKASATDSVCYYEIKTHAQKCYYLN